MGKRGPQRIPTATLKLRGSWLAKTRPAEPAAILGDPDCPYELDGAGVELWRKTLDIMRESQTLSKGDGAVIAGYVLAVRAVATAKRAPAKLKWLAMQHRFASALGLSPASRASVTKVSAPAKPDGVERFFKGG